MTKWVNTHKRRSNHNCVYHTSERCQYVVPNSKKASEVSVDVDKLEECKFCSGSVSRTQTKGIDCPFCKETVSKLPDHLPCEKTP